MNDMNLFVNLYNDKDEILEWLATDNEASKAFDSGQNNGKEPELEDLRTWLSENECFAQRYREYHFQKQWSI